MRKLLFFLTIICSSIVYSQRTFDPLGTLPPKIEFQYDSAGNQITRYLCLNCSDIVIAQKKSAEIIKEDIKFDKFFPKDVISYYPNPVKEELHLKWELIDGNSLSTIQIYSLNGQLLKTYNDLKNTNTESLSFREYAAGVYNVLLFYSNGDQKSIKIVKQ